MTNVSMNPYYFVQLLSQDREPLRVRAKIEKYVGERELRRVDARHGNEALENRHCFNTTFLVTTVIEHPVQKRIVIFEAVLFCLFMQLDLLFDDFHGNVQLTPQAPSRWQKRSDQKMCPRRELVQIFCDLERASCVAYSNP